MVISVLANDDYLGRPSWTRLTSNVKGGANKKNKSERQQQGRLKKGGDNPSRREVLHSTPLHSTQVFYVVIYRLFDKYRSTGVRESTSDI